MTAVRENILARLPDLSAADLREVIAKASFLSNPTGKVEAVTAKEPQGFTALFAAVNEVICAGNVKAPPWSAVARTKMGREFKVGAKEFLAFVEEEFKPKTQVDRLKITRTLLNCMAGNLRRKGKPVFIGTMGWQLRGVAQVCERLFPGYLSAGLLPFILRREKA